MNVATTTTPILAEGFLHASIQEQSSGSDSDSDSDWETFAESWNRLEPDAYMADGGRYRLRRYSEFDVDATTGDYALRTHVPYLQSKDINHLNGGIERRYEPIESSTHSSPVFRRAIAAAIPALAAAGYQSWRLQCFQNRILTTNSEAGQPAPEGRHRDGVDYVLTLLVDRHNVSGGESSVYTPDGTTLAARELVTPGEYILLDDNVVLHDVTPVRPVSSEDPGWRDVLIAMFTATSGS